MVVGDFTEELDVVVIGSGPGGYPAAIRAAQKGKKVAIIEREFVGGVCLNVGCIPSKALINAGHRYQHALDAKTFGITTGDVELDFEKTQQWKDKRVVGRIVKGVEGLLKKNDIQLIWGEANFVSENTLRVVNEAEDTAQTYSFNQAVLATGSSPIQIPGFEYSKERVIDSTGALNLKEVPEKLVVIGGGVVGSELGGAYANLGTDVTIIEGTDSILGMYEKDLVKVVEKDFKRKKKMDIITNAQAKEAKETDNGVEVVYEVDGEEKSVEADYVLVTVGRRANTDEVGVEAAGIEVGERGLVKVDDQGRTTNPNIFAIGDIVPGAALAHKATYEGKVAAEAIAGLDSKVDYIGMPSVAFTDPEIAVVGLTEEEAKEQGLNVKASKITYGANGRALSLDATDGFVRLVTTEEDDIIVGAQIVGAGASDMISELAVAVEGRLTAEDIALTIHPHPTLGELPLDVAELALGEPIHG